MGARRGLIFNEEKVLYFANQEQSFHVQPDEPKGSDCRALVSSLTAKGMLKPLSSDTSGEFYGITLKGKVRLLELQIKWRQSRGKDVKTHREELGYLLTELADQGGANHV